MKESFPTPIKLTGLVASGGVDSVRELALSIGALAIEPKPNQIWRCVLDGAIIIGYKTSVVVAGRDELAMEAAAAKLRAAVPELADDAYVQEQAHALDQAMNVRKFVQQAPRMLPERIEEWLAPMMAHFSSIATPSQDVIIDHLRRHAPEAARFLEMARIIYRLGWEDGYGEGYIESETADMLDDEEDDDVYLPEAADAHPIQPPQALPTGKVVSSA